MFDFHVHSAPDDWPRFADDDGTVAEYVAAGYTGCVLVSHHESTVVRAANAERVQDEQRLAVYGGIALNQHAGGVNPTAVAVTLNTGGRVIWFPTADAGAYAVPPVDPAAECDVRQICELITEADAVLATGHLSTSEVGWLVPLAQAYGVRRILLSASAELPAAEAAELADTGVLVEITAQQLRSRTAESLAAYARRVGLSNVVLSSDASLPDAPAAPDALYALIEALAAQGLDRSALEASAADTPRKLIEL